MRREGGEEETVDAPIAESGRRKSRNARIHGHRFPAPNGAELIATRPHGETQPTHHRPPPSYHAQSAFVFLRDTPMSATWYTDELTSIQSKIQSQPLFFSSAVAFD